MAHRFIVMKRHGISGLRVSGVSLVLTLLMLLSAPAAQAKFTDPPAPVASIQQGQNFNGHTWVRLVGPSCEGQGTQGWFLFPKTAVQQLQLEILLTAVEQGLKVSIDYNPETCVADAVGF